MLHIRLIILLLYVGFSNSLINTNILRINIIKIEIYSFFININLYIIINFEINNIISLIELILK